MVLTDSSVGMLICMICRVNTATRTPLNIVTGSDVFLELDISCFFGLLRG